MSRFALPIVLLAAALACAPTQPMPPAIPPLPSTPPPPPEERERFVVTVTGTVRDMRGQPVPHASVTVAPADPSCTPVGTAIGASTDERGEYLAIIDAPIGTDYSGCAVVEASSGGGRGSASATAHFNSSTRRRQFVRADVALEPPPPLTPAAARRLVARLSDTINDDSANLSPELALYVAQGPEALRVARDLYRKIVGNVVAIHETGEESSSTNRRVSFELVGSNGRTSPVDVHQEALTRIHSPLLDYGMRSQRFMFAYVRMIASGDAVRLAQLLNPDDIDFPVERAREMIVDYRRRYRDTATIQPELVDIDETRAAIRWRLRGTGADGTELTEDIILGYGDGLIGVRGL